MRKLAIVVALSSTVLATPALARNGAWYVGGDFGVMIVEDVDFDFGTGPTIPSSSTAQIAINHDYGYDAALFVGYDLGAFRVEAEVSYKRARVDDIETSVRFPGAPGTGIAVGGPITPDLYPAGGGRTSALSFMINGLLDFGDEDGISGFVGGGVGIARIDYNNIRAFSNQPAGIDDSDTRFAWQVVAGVRQAPLLQCRQPPHRGLPRVRIGIAVPFAQLAWRHHLQLRHAAAAGADPRLPAGLDPRRQWRVPGADS
jgi:OOP family OmpA-OmpF porin